MTDEFPVSKAGLDRAFAFLTHAVGELGLSEAISHRLSIILDELCSNMIRHDETLSEADSFALRLERTEALVVLTILDPGRPFNPFEHKQDGIPEIGGHGINLIKGLAQSVDYSREDGKNKVEIALESAE
ncbi:MAG: ATP-binding protein [Pseudomonadota bacterium]